MIKHEMPILQLLATETTEIFRRSKDKVEAITASCEMSTDSTLGPLEEQFQKHFIL